MNRKVSPSFRNNINEEKEKYRSQSTRSSLPFFLSRSSFYNWEKEDCVCSYCVEYKKNESYRLVLKVKRVNTCSCVRLIVEKFTMM